MNTVQQHHALIVADHPVWTKSAQRLFEAKDFHVTVAIDTEHAKGLLRQEHPDIVLIGLRLPRGSAYDLCELVRSDPKLDETRIIILGEKIYPEDVAFAEESGADAFLNWPLTQEELDDVMASLLLKGGVRSGRAPRKEWV